ncbi:GRIP1-associated protein 1-like [Haliotis rufescens]|uniref:GRIP1-associated protein 1-like n=1 Tax=Haliotis rufescens TaxID=6454 RepID=UPI00201FA4AF|nr:GRIP1-associated protein 1-like [Haliotis rufescens]
MASALSEEEFHRMQLQLIELRTTNYEFEGKVKKIERELLNSVDRNEALEKDLIKANKAISKSKKAKEVELLLQESDGLQRKLQSQEEEFRLQNQTLMQELSTLVARNEELEKEAVEKTQSGGDNSTQQESNPALEDEVRRLQAQNAVLQKNLTASQEKYEQLLSQGMSDSSHVTGVREAPTGDEANREDIQVDGQDATDSSANTSVQDGPETGENRRVEDLAEELNKLKLNLETESEEKKILRDQLTSCEKKYKDQLNSLQDEVEKLTEKLKKKQESFVNLQSEKEELFKESNKKIEELQSARDRDQKYYQDQINKLQQEIEKLRKFDESKQSSSDHQIQDLQRTVKTLQSQVDAAGIVGTQQLQEQSSKYEHQVTELQNKVEQLSQNREDLQLQLRESQKASQETLDQLQAAQKERDTEIQALQEVSKIAEKRKSLLDELAIKYQKDCDAHHAYIKQGEEKHGDEVQALQKQIEELGLRCDQLEKYEYQCDELQTRVKSLEDAKGWLERRLKETEENMEQVKRSHEEVISEMKSSQEVEMLTLRSSHDEEVAAIHEQQQLETREWQTREETLMEEIGIQKERITCLEQEIKDSVGEKKIHEKKGMTMLKDLKRQLHAERKRAEKLQERLQDVLSDTKNRQSIEDLFRPIDPSDPLRGDSSSVSSWSAGASGLGTKDSMASGPQSPNHTANFSFTSEVEQEYGELMARVADVQQQKWTLEEKVSHLEMSNACMADDLLKKTAIISYYVMDSRSDRRPSHSHNHDEKLSLNKILEVIKKGDDQELKDMNKKLQRMLEETLTKNMHLQQDLEMMSQEVVRLSKISHSQTTPQTPPDDDGMDITDAGDVTSS